MKNKGAAGELTERKVIAMSKTTERKHERLVPTWTQTLNALLGPPFSLVKVSDEHALEALNHMARVADMYVEEHKTKAEKLRCTVGTRMRCRK